MNEPIWTDEVDEYYEYDMPSGLGFGSYGRPPESATNIFRCVPSGIHKVIQGEVIEEGESPPVLERGKMAVPPQEGSSSRAAHGAGSRNAGNISIQVPVLQGLAPDKTGANNR